MHLLQHLSNFPPALQALVSGLADPKVRGRPQSVRRTASAVKPNRILQPTEINELLAEYAAGATMIELAQRYGVHRATVRMQIDRAGLQRRSASPPLNSEQVARSAVLYSEGWSTYRLATHYGVSQNAVYRALKRAGVRLRPRGKS